VWSGKEYNSTMISRPLDETEDIADIEKKVRWPEPSWFDYSQVAKSVETHADKAILVGHWGPFQTCTSVIRDDQLYYVMAANPDFAKALCDRMHRFQMWHYENIFKAGKEVRRYVSCLGSTNGYILYPSQAWESCVPIENIEATYEMELRYL
jgi:hypothetical protein